MIKIITIDGPASSGKGTVARIIAKELGYNYLDSGAIYRVLALVANRNNFDENDIEEIIKLIPDINLQFINNKVLINEEDVTQIIREEKIGMLASKLGKNAKIRNALLQLQHSFAKSPGLVTDGRDMGSIVFPKALLKVFLTATPEMRAKRRVKQLQLLGKYAKIEDILQGIIARDMQDSTRNVAPLAYDSSFKVLDNSSLSIEDTVIQILSWFKSLDC